MGNSAGYYLSTGYYNVYIGYNAGYSTAITGTNYENVGLGYQCFESITSGYRNTGMGSQAGRYITSAANNFALGYGALYYNVTGDENVAIGLAALYGATTKSYTRSIAIGSNAGRYAIGSYNLYIGYAAGYGPATNTNLNTYNIGIGVTSLRNITTATATENVALGHNALYTLTTGNHNVAIGGNAGYTGSTFTNCVFLGEYAGYYETGNAKLFIDNQTRTNEATSRTNSLIYGVFNAAIASQYLYFNSNVYIGDNTATPKRLVIDTTGDTWWEGAGSGVTYGDTYGTHIGWSQAAAAQNTWYNVSDADMNDGELNLVTSDGSGKLTVSKAGRYLIIYKITVECSVANDHLHAGIEISGAGTASASGQCHWENKFADEEESMGGSTVLSLAAGATIEISVMTADAATPTISVQSLNITVAMVGG
jgi:hypothetical protein